MAREFDDLGSLALHLLTCGPAMVVALQEGLDLVGERLVNTMAAKPGTYQGRTGPFPAWAPLAQSTEDRKARLGQPADSPLIGEGYLADSFSYQRQGFELAAGSTDPKMVFHEFGTTKMPPRPVVGPAGFQNKAVIEKLVGAAAVAGLIGADDARGLLAGEIHESLGYGYKTR